MKPLGTLLLTCFLASLVMACGDEHGHDEDPDIEGCEHLQDGPATGVTATADSDSAPLIADDHMRYDVTLIDVGGQMGGFVRFDADEASDFLFFVDADAPIALTDSSGAAVEIEESATGSEACSEIRGRHLVPLTVGTHYLELGPTSVTEVGIVVEPFAHEHDHDE